MNLSKQAQAGRYSRAGKARSRRGYDGPEGVLQSQVESYLDARGLDWQHVPPVLNRLCSVMGKLPLHQKQQISDYTKGIPDILIRHRAGQYPRLLAIELKNNRGRVTGAQQGWLMSCYGPQWGDYVLRDFNSVVLEIDRFVVRCEAEQKGWEEYLKLEEK